jgi:hypothetical protein
VSGNSLAHGTDDPDLGGDVRLGSALFTLVEPHRGHEVAYNRWYERDHFYAGCMIGPWYFAGRRWVCTRDLKDMRITGPDGQPPLFGDDRAGSYLALYWTLKGRFRENTDWSTRQVHWLHRHGRMFPERDHIHTLLYIYKGSEARDADPVPPVLATDSPVALVLSFRAVPLPADAPVSQPGTEGVERRELQLWFAGTEPAGWWSEAAEYAAAVGESGDGVVRWASSFMPTVPGTDRYTDELW